MQLLRKSVWLNLVAALSIFVPEWLLSNAYTEISIRTYAFFLALYVVFSLVAGVAASLALWLTAGVFRRPAWRSDRAAFLPAIFLAVYVTLYSFYYINKILIPMIGMLAVQSLLANMVCLGVGLAVFRLAVSVEVNARGGLAAFLQIGLLPLVCLVAANLRFFAWQPPSVPNGELATAVFGLAAAPLAGIALVRKLSEKLPGGRGYYAPAVANVMLGALVIWLFARQGAPSAASFLRTADPVVTASPAPNPRNIVWIVTDTARRDHISVYGGRRNATPHLRKFSDEALVFDRAISAAPWTAPSHASMFTGMYPSRHGAHYFRSKLSPLPRQNLTLAEMLSARGYQTAGIVANNAGLARWLGCSQGFQYYFDALPFVFSLVWGKALNALPKDFRIDELWVNEACLSGQINPIVYSWLDRRDPTRPFFLFINYMEPHGGIAFVPQPYDSLYGFDRDEHSRVFLDFDARKVMHFESAVTEPQRKFWTGYVQRKLTFMDANIGALFARLKKMGLYDDTMIIVNSDHGELFGEHNSFSHNTDLYNELIWIPLMVKYPQAEKKGRSQRLVQTVDIMPEILSYIGVDVPVEVQGQPLSVSAHPAVAELFAQRYNANARLFPRRYYRDLKAIISVVGNDSLKYIWSSNEKSELFDLAADPEESANLIAARRAQADSLGARLRRWRKSFAPVSKTRETSARQRKEIENRLRSLGYIK